MADWLEEWGKEWVIQSHVDAFFVRRIFADPAKNYRECANQLRKTAHQSTDGTQLIAELRRLVRVFDAQLSIFERKRFVNLSHEANKAMNLNTYLGLMGKSWKVQEGHEGMYLEQGVAGDADLHIPASKYIITLDADSVLLNEYALRLVAVMEAEGNERVAVTQTPYSAFPSAERLLERVAGATIHRNTGSPGGPLGLAA